jgi:hypothetical protein
MLTNADLQRLQRELADHNVLSVYLDTGFTDPAMREAWKPALQSVLRDARAQITDDTERAAFERAAALLRDPQPSPSGTWGAPGWVAFVVADGVRYAGDVQVAPGTLAVWRRGPVIAPYLRALKQLRPVLVALVESGAARLFRYATGTLEGLGQLNAPGQDAPRAGRPTAPSVMGASAPAPRGTTGSDFGSRRQDAAFDRLVATLGQRLAQLDGGESWVLIGGTPEWARLAGDALLRQFAGRILVSATLDHDASDNEIIAAAKQAATELRATQGVALVEQLIEQAGAQARATVGIPATQRALRAHAVDLLLVTPNFISAHEREVEDFVRASMASGGDVEVPSGRAAEYLDHAADGIAARLRFALDASPHAGGDARAR